MANFVNDLSWQPVTQQEKNKCNKLAYIAVTFKTGITKCLHIVIFQGLYAHYSHPHLLYADLVPMCFFQSRIHTFQLHRMCVLGTDNINNESVPYSINQYW